MSESLEEYAAREVAAYIAERKAEVRRLRVEALKLTAKAAGVLVLILLLVTLPLARAMGFI